MTRPRNAAFLALLALLVLAALALVSCGDETDGEICRDATSAQACESCCEEAGYGDWSYNAEYTPACTCII